MSEPKQVISGRGVLTFDGQVVEAFGCSRETPVRVHVALLEKLNVDEAVRGAAPNLEVGGR